jgi:hypothetical protein
METLQYTSASEIKVLLNGKEHVLKRPRARQTLKFEEDIQGAKAGDKSLTNALVEFIVSCGMDKDTVLDEMDLDLINELATALIQGKKKSLAN